jgi:hypothetical protein
MTKWRGGGGGLFAFFVNRGPHFGVSTSVADPGPFDTDTDPGPAFHFDTESDPDPAFQFYPDLSVGYGSGSLLF